MTQQFDDYAKEESPLMEKMTSIIELCKKKCMGSEQRRATLLNIQLVNERLVLEKDQLMLEILVLCEKRNNASEYVCLNKLNVQFQMVLLPKCS